MAIATLQSLSGQDGGKNRARLQEAASVGKAKSEETATSYQRYDVAPDFQRDWNFDRRSYFTSPARWSVSSMLSIAGGREIEILATQVLESAETIAPTIFFRQLGWLLSLM